MRIIGSVDSQKNAKRLSAYLRSSGIENTCEISFDKRKDQIVSSLWVHDEDDVEKASQIYNEFIKDPENAKYDTSQEHERKPFSAIENPGKIRFDEAPPRPKIFHGYVTYFFVILCSLIYLFNYMQEMNLVKESNSMVFLTPVQEYLLYDMPAPLLRVNELIQKHQISKDAPPEEISKEAQEEFKEINQLPYFHGYYELMIEKISKKAKARAPGPMFTDIKKGEVWRLFTPAILHKDLIHILFNMLWLWLLGKQIEIRLSRWKFFIFILLVGVITNTAQYLVSGPYFMGFSGIVLGMAGYIWMRQKIAPWEGYPLNRATILFLAFFILAMVGIQLFYFFMQISGKEALFYIANTAHIVGAITGALLGRISFFAGRAT